MLVHLLSLKKHRKKAPSSEGCLVEDMKKLGGKTDIVDLHKVGMFVLGWYKQALCTGYFSPVSPERAGIW